MEKEISLGYVTRANQSIVRSNSTLFLSSGYLLFHMHVLHLLFVSLRREILAAMSSCRVGNHDSDVGCWLVVVTIHSDLMIGGSWR